MQKGKRQLIFIHGAESFSEYKDFLEYLKTCDLGDPLEPPKKRWKNELPEALEGLCDVYMPQMPNKQNAKYEEWKIWFERHFQFLTDGALLVGYSQGGYFLLKYLSENTMPVSVAALFLVATPSGPDDFGGEDGGDFVFDHERVKDIASGIKDIHMFHSKDDFVVPYRHAEVLQELLPSATLHTFEDRGHFLTESFPELVESIKVALQRSE